MLSWRPIASAPRREVRMSSRPRQGFSAVRAAAPGRAPWGCRAGLRNAIRVPRPRAGRPTGAPIPGGRGRRTTPPRKAAVPTPNFRIRCLPPSERTAKSPTACSKTVGKIISAGRCDLTYPGGGAAVSRSSGGPRAAGRRGHAPFLDLDPGRERRDPRPDRPARGRRLARFGAPRRSSGVSRSRGPTASPHRTRSSA